MKKIIVLALTTLITVSMIYAQTTVGVKGTFGMNFGSELTDESNDSFLDSIVALLGEKSFTNVFMVNGGGSIYGRYNIPAFPALGVQLELGLTINNGAGIKTEILGYEYSYTISYTSLDFPLLVTYNIPISSVLITPMVGMNFSIPVGTPTTTTTTDDRTSTGKMDGYKVTGFIPGFIAGIEVGIPAGTNAITLGLSYVNDFTPVHANIENLEAKTDLVTRSNLNISLGYTFKL